MAVQAMAVQAMAVQAMEYRPGDCLSGRGGAG
jgi:hypothetical protein